MPSMQTAFFQTITFHYVGKLESSQNLCLIAKFLAPYGLELSRDCIYSFNANSNTITSDCATLFSCFLFLLLFNFLRIQPLSEALDDLYKEFNALKAHLGDLTEKFVPLETFIDELKTEKANAAPINPVRRRVIKKTTPVS